MTFGEHIDYREGSNTSGGDTPRNVPARVLAILAEVAEVHQVTVGEMLGERRLRRIAYARFDAWCWLWRIPGPAGVRPSLTQIGSWFGKNPTSVLYGIRKWERRSAESGSR